MTSVHGSGFANNINVGAHLHSEGSRHDLVKALAYAQRHLADYFPNINENMQDKGTNSAFSQPISHMRLFGHSYVEIAMSICTLLLDAGLYYF